MKQVMHSSVSPVLFPVNYTAFNPSERQNNLYYWVFKMLRTTQKVERMDNPYIL